MLAELDSTHMNAPTALILGVRDSCGGVGEGVEALSSLVG